MLELYHNDMSSCAQKVRIVLAEKGLDWQSHHLNLRAGEAVTPHYLQLNPNGVVPTLIDNGQVVIESEVICEYLDDAYPDTPLRPADPLARARMRLWTKQPDEGVHAATGVISSCIAFREQHLKKNPEQLAAYLDRVPGPERREHLRDAIENGTKARAFPGAVRRYEKLLADMEETLSQSPWLAGDSFSLADIAYMPYLLRLEHLRLDVYFTGRPHVRAWHDKVKQRQSWQTAIGDWINPGYIEIMQRTGKEAAPKVAAILAAA